jgi:hypothetical protein
MTMEEVRTSTERQCWDLMRRKRVDNPDFKIVFAVIDRLLSFCKDDSEKGEIFGEGFALHYNPSKIITTVRGTF